MKIKIYSAGLFLIMILISCARAEDTGAKKLVNTAHLDNLYEEVNADGNSFGIIHIYSDYPDYKWVGDDDEGMACVDDAARAAVFYMMYSEQTGDKAAAAKAEKLCEFLLHMQAENGFYFNFIFPDLSVNTKHQNSVAEPNWWSWRALWALTEGYAFFIGRNPGLNVKIKIAIDKTVESVKNKFVDDKTVVDLDGFSRPSWLPYKYASDQASLMVIALSKYEKLFNDTALTGLINDFCDGIILMQEGSAEEFPYYAFLSWENSWHAWGNLQSYALLNAYELTRNEKYLDASLREINHFYEYLLREKFLTGFSVKKENQKVAETDVHKFSQIAYGIRPMVFAALKAAQLTGDKKYSVSAANYAGWFFGINPAGSPMYSQQTGICYDGIMSSEELNKNSGAESTIEALLSLQAIESDSEALKTLNEIINDQGGKK